MRGPRRRQTHTCVYVGFLSVSLFIFVHVCSFAHTCFDKATANPHLALCPCQPPVLTEGDEAATDQLVHTTVAPVVTVCHGHMLPACKGDFFHNVIISSPYEGSVISLSSGPDHTHYLSVLSGYK